LDKTRLPDSRDLPGPASTFGGFGLHPDLMRAVRDLGFERPTPIQGLAIPPVLQGRDVLAAAATGSGKTAAFVLPILHRMRERARGKTRVLVLAPTRELAAQIAEHTAALAKYTRQTVAAVFGGVGMQPQVDAFRRGVDVLVATPGRLLDHMQHEYARLDGLDVLVIDEADRMLDMGFLPDVKRVLAQLPKQRQTLLFSATMPPPIVELSGSLLHAPVAINVDRKSAPARGITHAIYPVPEPLKTALLTEILRVGTFDSVLVFTRTKHRANRLAERLDRAGFACVRIHGNCSQTNRTDAMQGFKQGRYRILVATDIAARGIDVNELALVVNFDIPHVPEDYIHRVGRTARADATGRAVTLVAPEDQEDLRRIERHVGRRLPVETIPGFDYDRKSEERLEIPIAERIAEIRKRKAEERARAREKAERRAAAEAAAAEAKAGKEAGRMHREAQVARRRDDPAARPGPRPPARPAPERRDDPPDDEGAGPILYRWRAGQRPVRS
jgi:ATP-dependent RNA helicase RhlE